MVALRARDENLQMMKAINSASSNRTRQIVPKSNKLNLDLFSLEQNKQLPI